MKKILTLCLVPKSEFVNSEERGNQWGEEELMSFNVVQLLHIHASLGKCCKHDRAINSFMHKKELENQIKSGTLLHRCQLQH